MNFGFIRGDRVDSNNTKQKTDDSMFNKVIADVYKQIKYNKKSRWCYLPEKEHLECLIKKINNEIELEVIEEKDYIKVRKIINKGVNNERN